MLSCGERLIAVSGWKTLANAGLSVVELIDGGGQDDCDVKVICNDYIPVIRYLGEYMALKAKSSVLWWLLYIR